MGEHTWEGWQTSVSDAPQPTSVLFGANLRVSSIEDSPVSEGKGPDSVMDLLKKFNLPLTRDNYLGLAYSEGLPGDWGAKGEAVLPEQIRKA